jgi:hypothetical protein
VKRKEKTSNTTFPVVSSDDETPPLESFVPADGGVAGRFFFF